VTKFQEISSYKIALCAGRELSPAERMSQFVAPATHGVFDTVFLPPDYIEANPKQRLSLTTSLTNAPQYPLTDTGGLADLNSRGEAKSVTLSKLIGLLKE